jgi:eukaryotic-like serine/threonine-protein kinase
MQPLASQRPALRPTPVPQVVTIVELSVPALDPRGAPLEVKPAEPARATDAVPSVASRPVVVADPRPRSKPAAKARGLLTLDPSRYTEVFLNGKRLGDAPLGNFPLPAGRQVLQLVNEDKKIRRSIEVEIEAGKTIIKKL